MNSSANLYKQELQLIINMPEWGQHLSDVTKIGPILAHFWHTYLVCVNMHWQLPRGQQKLTQCNPCHELKISATQPQRVKIWQKISYNKL